MVPCDWLVSHHPLLLWLQGVEQQEEEEEVEVEEEEEETTSEDEEEEECAMEEGRQEIGQFKSRVEEGEQVTSEEEGEEGEKRVSAHASGFHNSSRLLQKEELMAVFRSAHSGPTCRQGELTVGLVSTRRHTHTRSHTVCILVLSSSGFRGQIMTVGRMFPLHGTRVL